MQQLADITAFENLTNQAGSNVSISNYGMGFHTLLPGWKDDEDVQEPKKRRRTLLYLLGKLTGGIDGAVRGFQRHRIHALLKQARDDFHRGCTDGFESGYKGTMNRRTVHNALTDKLKRAGRIAALTAALSGLGGTPAHAANPSSDYRITYPGRMSPEEHLIAHNHVNIRDQWTTLQEPWIRAHEPPPTTIQSVSEVMRPKMGALREKSATAFKQNQLRELQKIQRDTITFRYDDVDGRPDFSATLYVGDAPGEVNIRSGQTAAFCNDVKRALAEIWRPEGDYSYFEITGKNPGDSQVEWLKDAIEREFPTITIIEHMNE